MKKLFAAVIVLATLASPVKATPSLWTCSNLETVLYLVVDVDNKMSYTIFSSDGGAMAVAHFKVQRTKDGNEFLLSELSNGVAVGLIQGKGRTMILGISRSNDPIVKFDCT